MSLPLRPERFADARPEPAFEGRLPIALVALTNRANKAKKSVTVSRTGSFEICPDKRRTQ